MPRKSYPSSKAISGMYFPSSASSGNCIPFQASILVPCVPLRPPRVGCTFRKAPQRETTSHSKGKFRDALSETPPIRKARPTLNTSSEHMRACCPERPRHRGDGKYRPRRLPSLRPRVSRKKPRGFRGFHHLYCFARRTANGEATLPARPSWPPPPYGPDHPWWGDPLRQPSCRAAS